MAIKVKHESAGAGISIDKIPIKEVKEDPITSTYKLGTLEISPCEYANAFKINDIIDAMIIMQGKITRLEDR